MQKLNWYQSFKVYVSTEFQYFVELMSMSKSQEQHQSQLFIWSSM